jgi:hypothetical protein
VWGEGERTELLYQHTYVFLTKNLNTRSSCELTIDSEDLDTVVVFVSDNEVVPGIAAHGGGLVELAVPLALRPELGVKGPVLLEQLNSVVRAIRHHDQAVLTHALVNNHVFRIHNFLVAPSFFLHIKSYGSGFSPDQEQRTQVPFTRTIIQ